MRHAVWLHDCVVLCVQSMLSKLLVDGPTHDGVFRLSPFKNSYEAARAEIDAGTRLDVTDLAVNTVARLLKVNYILIDIIFTHLLCVVHEFPFDMIEIPVTFLNSI